MKYIFVVVGIVLCTGCDAPIPAPEVAIKSCIEAGMLPTYISTVGNVNFTCTPHKK